MAALVSLPGTPDEVWTRLLQWERQAEWMADADSVEVLTERREGVGVRIAVRTRLFDVPAFTEILEVVEWDPPRLLRLRHSGVVDGFGTWELQARPDGTAFRWTEDVRLRIPVVGEVAALVYAPFMRWLMRRSMVRLRAYLAT